MDMVSGTATSTASAATINNQSGMVTTEALTTAAGATYLMTITNSLITANAVVLPTVGRGTATSSGLVPIAVTPGAGSVAIVYQNVGLNAVNGTMKLGFTVFNL